MIPALVIAGTHSGCGKTTVACGVMGALRRRGYRVAPFKVGPDFIDPTHHRALCGRPSRNLDPFMMGEEGVRCTFAEGSKGADIAILEGVMGMFDGLEGGDTGSTAHVARILGAPVVLVAEVSGMSRSVHALIRGFSTYDPTVNLTGVIFNRVGGEHHHRMIESSLSVPAFGWIPRRPEGEVPSRHLGLHLAEENRTLEMWGPLVEEHCDLDGLVQAARIPDASPSPASRSEPPSLRVGVAWDAAFCFYYQDNLDRLRRWGAEPVFFSPLQDPLPEIDLLYLGGGYPELHARALSESPCTAAIRKAAMDGLPVYAECGGLIYLCRNYRDQAEYPLAGVLPADARMHPRFQALGYIEATGTGASPLIPEGVSYRGHEFHYSSVECDPDARFGIRLLRGDGIGGGRDGLCEHRVLGSYAHAYFTDKLVRSLRNCARRYRKE